MANNSIYAAFERMWQHTSNIFAKKTDLDDLGAITIDLEGSSSGTPNPVNADTLGGYSVQDIMVNLVQEVVDSIKVEYPEAHVIYGDVDSNNNIVIFGELADGTYTLKYENEDGTVIEIGDLVVGENVIVYINQIPISKDDSGAIYNGVGYKAGVRWSTSSKAEKEHEGSYLSGWIPVNYGDIVYLEKVPISKDANAVANQNNVAFANPDKSVQWNYYTTTLETMENPVFDSNGYLTQFTIPAGTSFIRFTAQYIGEDSIVTINEPIV